MINFILLSCSFTFCIKNTDGPFGIINYLRRFLLNSKLGPTFYNLFNCYYCLGFHTSWMSYCILYYNQFVIIDLITHSFIGAITTMFLMNILDWILQQKD